MPAVHESLPISIDRVRRLLLRDHHRRLRAAPRSGQRQLVGGEEVRGQRQRGQHDRKLRQKLQSGQPRRSQGWWPLVAIVRLMASH